MANGLDAKVNGSGAPRKAPSNGTAGSPAGTVGAQGDDDGALDGMALANLSFVEDLYFQFLSDPNSVDPTWRRTFQGQIGRASCRERV